MAYSLQDFCADLSKTIKAEGVGGLPHVATRLSELLKNPAFVAETFQDDTPYGKRELWRDPDTDARVMAHVQQAGKGGKPHSHGESWAIYGNALGFTDMTEWRRVNPESEEQVVLEVSEKYRIGPGDTHAYPPRVIHSTAHPEKAWVVRITGTDLDTIPRYHFRSSKDKIVENA
jgi:hypothetical protein